MTKPLPGSERMDPALALALDARLRADGADDSELIARVKERIMQSVRAEADAGHRTVRASDDAWENVAPGIDRKILWESGPARSWMVRLAPGALFPAHLHPMDEECVVLEGSLRIGDILLHAGDFHVGRQESMHGVTSTDTGAVVYLRGALSVHA